MTTCTGRGRNSVKHKTNLLARSVQAMYVVDAQSLGTCATAYRTHGTTPDIPSASGFLFFFADEAKGFVKSLADKWDSAHTFHQLCEWHMVQNIKKRLVEGSYNKAQQDRIQHLIWKYVHCTTKHGVDEARNELYYEMHTAERKYMEENWRHKEIQVLRYYT